MRNRVKTLILMGGADCPKIGKPENIKFMLSVSKF